MVNTQISCCVDSDTLHSNKQRKPCKVMEIRYKASAVCSVITNYSIVQLHQLLSLENIRKSSKKRNIVSIT